MTEVASRAQLIDASDLGARSQRIAATVPRAEIEDVLQVEQPPELILEIDRRGNGDVDGHMFRVAWTEDQLKGLLRDTSGEEITLLFDADELDQALAGEDIEAHGVREKTAAVLTVAAMAAGVAAAAQPASAKTMASGGGAAGAGATIEMVSDAASSGSTAAPELIADSASSGPAGVQVAEASGPELVSDAALTGTLSHLSTADLAGTVSTPEASDSGLSTSEIAGTAVGGGMILLITAAGFALRGKHRPEQFA